MCGIEAVGSSTLNPKLDYPVKERQKYIREQFRSNVADDLAVIECVGWRPLRQRRASRGVAPQSGFLEKIKWELFMSNVSEDFVAAECLGWRLLRRRHPFRSVAAQWRFTDIFI